MENNDSASAVVAEIQEIANILMVRCAKHAAEKADIRGALQKALGEIEILKGAAHKPAGAE